VTESQTEADSGFSLASKRHSEFGVCAHESIEREATIEATGVRQDPGRNASKCYGLAAPMDIPQVHHGCKRAFSEKRNRTWRKAAHPLLEFERSLSEFV
jgi:hypothetical protein